jgi:uncharacterized damage-inducible protein DinB
MTVIDDQGRPEPPLAADETATLLGYLDYQRSTLEWKTRGLDADGLRATTARSTISLGGLLKHLSYVEDKWFSWALWGNEQHPPWDTVDWSADHDWEWHTAADDPPEVLRAMWADAVERSRRLTADALADGGLDHLAVQAWAGSSEVPSLRWILVHMIEEYARHNGHADLLREAVDGQTGE